MPPIVNSRLPDPPKRRLSTKLDDIAYYVAVESGSLETADRLLQSIYSRFLMLASFRTLADNEMTFVAVYVFSPRVSTSFCTESKGTMC